MSKRTAPAGKTRGRPRKFDEDAVLQAAAFVFWEKGFAGASLDDLSSAMGMTRPSIYNAFGDKVAIYITILRRFADDIERRVADTLFMDGDLSAALKAFYRMMLEIYLSPRTGGGCLVFCTAPAAAAAHPSIQSELSSVIERADEAFAARFAMARQTGSSSAAGDVTVAARLATAILHSLALRARSGAARRDLEAFIDDSVDTAFPD